MKKIILLLILFSSCIINSQTLYWVGGSGNWSDANHWSLVSGGASSGIVPTPSTHLIFDDNSTASDAEIEAIQSIEVSSIDVSIQNYNIKLIGSNLITLKLNSYANFNPHFKFNFNGKVILTPTHNVSYDFSHTTFSNEIVVNSNYDVELGAIYSISNVTFTGN